MDLGYWLRGYTMGRFRATPIRQKLIDTLGEIQREEFARDGYFFKVTERSRRKDFRPNAHTYSDVFLDVLLENDIPAFLRRTIGYDMTLANIHIVDSVPPGYSTEWHTDNFLDSRIHKLLFYPSFGGPPQPRFEILRGHHRPVPPKFQRVWDNRVIRAHEPRWFAHDAKVLYGCDDTFVLTNTQVPHRAYETDRPAIRILYSFRRPFRSVREVERYLAVQPGTVEDVLTISERYEHLAGLRCSA